jgi:hypothetical protein
MDDLIIDAVIEQIKKDLETNDEYAIYEMLKNVSKKNLLAYLPEDISNELKKLN